MEAKPECGGYQKLAQLMTKHGEVAMLKRFDFLNNLNLLYLQAELVHLEQETKDHLSNISQEAKRTAGSNDQRQHYANSEPSLKLVERAGSITNSTSGLSAPAVEENASAKSQGQGGAPLAISPNGNPDKVNITAFSDALKQLEDRSATSTLISIPPPDAARDWWDLAHAKGDSEAAEAWKTMLEARAKLKEYNEAIYLQIRLRAAASPNENDLKFVGQWFEGETMGNLPLNGLDSEVWETSSASELVALKPRQADDPLAGFFLKRVFVWWHYCIGRRVQKPVDVEANYFEYNDRRVLKVADCVGSIIWSVFLTVSVVVLYFVTSMPARLGILVTFTVLFSLVMTLVTNARKAEVFAGTAAFAAVLVVFISSTFNSITP